MWDLRVANPFGSASIRKFLLFVAAMMVTVFAYIFITAPTTYAADATWNGSAITYDGNQYVELDPAQAGDGTGLPEGSQLYGYIDDAGTAHILSFPPGDDLSDVSTATYSEYDFTPPDNYSNRSNVQQVSIDPQTAANQGASSCVTEGVGWIVCPITNFLAGAMDWLYEILAGFLTVRPAQTSQDNALYRAWTFMRNFANIAFVIGFLIIIYSQLTSIGISNYGIKRTLPRLIVAAILVNVSYWVCAIAIDISNILGYAVQDIFIGMRNSIVGGEGNSWDIVSWESITGFILSGGTAAVALGVGGYALAAGTVGGAIYLLLPILVGVLLAVLVALLILAARQAIIVVCVILAPLAMVAYLLPNTEKYFDKWRGLFMTMLLVFPMFSVLFGGAQLAGIAIIQNADSINLIILGMAVQVAPVAITPFLIKFSGSLLGRIAGMVNNPNRGAIDRTKKFAQERAGQYKDRRLAAKNPNIAQHIDRKRREREGWQAANKGKADARWAKSRSYSNIQQATMEASQVKETGEASAQARYEAAKSTNPWVQSVDFELRAEKQTLENATTDSNINWENMRAGHTEGLVTAASVSQSGLARHVRSETERSQALASGLRGAQHVQQQQFAELLRTEDENDPRYKQAQEALNVAAGIDPNGRLTAQATAMSSLVKEDEETLNKTLQYLNAKAIGEKTTLKEYTAHIVRDARDGRGGHSPSVIKAAIEQQAREGQVGLIEDSLGSLHINSEDVADVIARNSNTMKSKGGFHVQADPMKLSIQTIRAQNPTASDAELKNIFQQKLAAARIDTFASSSAESIADFKVGFFNSFADDLENQINLARQSAAASHPDDSIARGKEMKKVEENLKAAYYNIHQASANEDIAAKMSDRKSKLEGMDKVFKDFKVPLDTPHAVAERHKTDKDKK